MAATERGQGTRAALMAIGIFELIFGIVILLAVITCARCAQDNAYLSTLVFVGPLLILVGIGAASVAAMIRRNTPIAPPFVITTGAGVAAVLVVFLAVTTRIVVPPVTDALLVVGALTGAILLARVIQARSFRRPLI